MSTIIVLLVAAGFAPFHADIRVRSSEQGVICLSASHQEEFHRACWVRDQKSPRMELRSFVLRSAGNWDVTVSLDGRQRDHKTILVRGEF
jgi:hypothetical protein